MLLQANNLSYAYIPRQPVLEDVSVSLEAGQVLYLLGRNGSGKTTLLNCLSGISQPRTGEVRLDGRPLSSFRPPERARHIGIIPQIHRPAFAFSIREMVLMGRTPHMSMFAQPKKADYEVADHALEMVGLSSFSQRPYTDLSGGERQLVMIARGLAQQCRVLLMDEPGAHLDPNNHQRVMEIVSRLAREEELAFIVSSHSPNYALVYATDVLVLKDGRALAVGEPSEIMTEDLLGVAYEMSVEVVVERVNGHRVVKAIVPRRPPVE
jgi:iron complex transport system ATP-binding protein